MDSIKSHKDPHDIARRLSKESVQNHQATRLKEHGQAAHASGAGYNAALQAQADIGNYLNNVGANALGGVFSGAQGGRREIPGDGAAPVSAPGYGGQGHTGAVPTGGEASQFYGSGQSQPGYQPQYSAPPAPPPQGGASLGFPSPVSAPSHTPPYGGGYSPNYGGSQPSASPSFPSAPGFPSPGGAYAPPSLPPPGGGFPQPSGGFLEPGFGGGFAPPPGPPSFPGGPPSPAFPDALQQPDNNTYPGQHHGHGHGHGHGHHQHHHQQQGGGYNPTYGSG
ncbi:hypothetical protein FS749_006504 [Ceratobasidium sp. UAMH 11750]|nr:hypothetical protein FS749_006504 [Ceratobasidium sp. UAMH 11750]